MKYSLLKEVQTKIQKRKITAEKIAQDNLATALKNDLFKQTYQQLKSIMIENARCEVFGKESNLTLQTQLQNQLDIQLKNLKIENIEPKYNCTKCNDCGIVDGSYCECLKNEATKILLENSNFGKLEEFKNSNFEIFENKDEIKKIYDLMQKWCNKDDSEKKIIYLLGDVGTGKTHLMRCMADAFIKQNKMILLTTAFSLSQEFLKYHTSKEKGDELSNLLDCEVLFIDDLGTEPFYNNITREYTYLIINERKMRNLRTVITSNLKPEDLRDHYDERIFSRIVDKKTSIVLQLKGDDKRLK